jgi:uncharacterized membrane protein YkoI
MRNKFILLFLLLGASSLLGAKVNAMEPAPMGEWTATGNDQDDQRRERRPEAQNNDRFPRQNYRDNGFESAQSDAPRDSKLRTAVAIAEGRGRVIRADPMGNGLFRVRVERDGRRVDLTIDANSGRILSER